MSIIIASLLFGTIAAFVAHNKARNALGWFMIGCLAGPFALVVSLLPMALKEGTTQACPQCSEIIKEEARICKYCHSGLRG